MFNLFYLLHLKNINIVKYFPERLVERRPLKSTTNKPQPIEPVTQPKKENLRKKERKPQPFEKIKPTFKSQNEFSERTYRPVIDYDYYDDGDTRIVPKTAAQV